MQSIKGNHTISSSRQKKIHFLLLKKAFPCYTYHIYPYFYRVFIKDTYLTRLEQLLRTLLPKNAGVFIFGSSLVKANFADIDLAFVGDIHEKDIASIREKLEESTLPYIFDLVLFEKTTEKFQKSILSSPTQWLISPQK